MADYTNYSFVSWSDTTPITSVRLNQMSTNTEQVKVITSENPQGIIKMITLSNNVTNGPNAIFANTKIIALTQETIGNIAYDNRVTLRGGRYYKLVLNLPGINQTDAGGEDSDYYIRFRTGNTAGSGDIIATFKLNSGVGTYINVASVTPAAIAQTAVRNDITFGAGKYEYVLANVSVTNQSYFVELERAQGSSNVNASGWTVLASAGALQFYIEDAGGVIGI
jgi:hypothetical protein